MKTIPCFLIFLGLLLLQACEPIEDQYLRDRYLADGAQSISKEDLQKALSITQPFPNKDGAIEGDQYVILKNSRPDVGGTWHLSWSTGEKILGTNYDTVIYESNGDFQIYYMGVSGGKVIKTDPVPLKVTNVFDPWDGYLTNAKNKADKTAKKKWKFRPYIKSGAVYQSGFLSGHGMWKDVPLANMGGWWGFITIANTGDQMMEFNFDGSTMTVFDGSRKQKHQGKFAFNHNKPEKGVLGELITTVPLIGGEKDDYGQGVGKNNVFWVLELNEKYMTLFHPEKYTGGIDWTTFGWYVFLEMEK